jgi:hypothetical protein
VKGFGLLAVSPTAFIAFGSFAQSLSVNEKPTSSVQATTIDFAAHSIVERLGSFVVSVLYNILATLDLPNAETVTP